MDSFEYWWWRVLVFIIGLIFPPGLFEFAYPILTSVDYSTRPYLAHGGFAVLVLIWVATYVGDWLFFVKSIREAP